MGDNTHATALRMAWMIHKRHGWKFSPHDLGVTASRILDGMREGERKDA